MPYNKYKDALPHESIARAQEVCKAVGAHVSVKVKRRLDGVYSAILTEQNCNWVTCGKGTSKEYCEASAYGEAIEHMSHYFAYNMNVLSANAQNSNGFQRYPDEQLLPIDQLPVIAPEVIGDLRDAYSLASGRHASDEELCAFLKEVFSCDETVFVPYYSIRRQRTVLLPEILIANLCGSNGCGAGNTPEEAVGHGLDELAERFSKHRIYYNDLTPPAIPRDYIAEVCPEILATIAQIENAGKFRADIRDCSLGLGLPVVAVILIDYENQKYLANFGSHPRFEIALERCITEMFQFYEVGDHSVKRKQMTSWETVPPHIIKSAKNWVSLLKDDVGFLPDSFFAGNCRWEFTPWPRSEEYSNKHGVNSQIHTFSQIASDIFIRNNSYLGFPAYRVYIPGVSSSQLPFDESQFRCAELCNWMMQKVQQQSPFSKDELRIIRDGVFSPKLFASSIFFHNMPESITYALYAALVLELGDADEALSLLQIQDDVRCRAAAKVLKLRAAKMPIEHVKAVISLFFDKEPADFARSWCDDNTFSALLAQWGTNAMPLTPGHVYTNRDAATEKLHLSIKAEMSRHNVDQYAIAQLLEPGINWK